MLLERGEQSSISVDREWRACKLVRSRDGEGSSVKVDAPLTRMLLHLTAMVAENGAGEPVLGFFAEMGEGGVDLGYHPALTVRI